MNYQSPISAKILITLLFKLNFTGAMISNSFTKIFDG